MSVRRWITGVVSLSVIAGLGIGVAGSAEAKAKPKLKVMTQNLYLGASLAPAMQATTGTGFLGAVDTIWASVLLTDFNLRAKTIAAEIKAQQPDLIGFQEATNWVTVNNALDGTPIPGYDYKTILLNELKALGLNYKVIGTSNNASINAPYDPAFAPAGVTVPSYGGCSFATCSITLNDRDIIMVNAANTKLSWKKAKHGNFKKQQLIKLPTGDYESFDRGWVYSDMTYKGKKFRFLNTHLETEDFPKVQEAQAKELLNGPANVSGTLITTGDFNSSAAGDVTKTYGILTKSWFKDTWKTSRDGAGLSCCQNEYLSNGVSELKTRIDLVLTHGKASGTSDSLIGDTMFSMTTPMWPSDHAGVVSTITLK